MNSTSKEEQYETAAEFGHGLGRPARRVSSGAGFASNVRHLRQKLGFTLRELAERSGIASSTISKVENGQISPTYDKILQLAAGLGVDVDELFYAQSTLMVPGMRSVTRAGGGTMLQSRDYTYEMLCSELSHKKFVPIIATLPHRTDHSHRELIRHRGDEFCYVLRGEVRILTELYEPLDLSTGDSCYFDSNMAHALIAGGDSDAVILWVTSANDAALAAVAATPVAEAAHAHLGDGPKHVRFSSARRKKETPPEAGE